MDKEAVRRLAAFRRQWHDPVDPGFIHYLDNPLQADLIGAAGELAFAERYRVPVPQWTRKGVNDGGVDFQTAIGAVSVKTSPTPFNLLILPKEMPTLARWIVLAKFDPQTETAALLGWTTDTVMRCRPTKVFGKKFGPQAFCPAERLAPMNHLAVTGLVDYRPDAYCCELHPGGYRPRGRA